MSPFALAALLATVQAAPAPVPAPAPAAPPGQSAVDQPRLAAAMELVELMRVEATLDRLCLQLAPVFAQGVIGAMAGSEDGKRLLAAIQAKPEGQVRLVAILSQEFLTGMRRQYPALKRGMAEEYGAAFALDELRAITAFYRTGAGAKVLALQSELQAKMAERGRELGRAAGEAAGVRAMERAVREILERPAQSARPTT